MRRTLAAAVLTLAALSASAGTAFAADDYTPDTNPKITLAGSTASSDCLGDVPVIRYSVALTDPDNVATSHTVYLRLTDGSNVENIKLGELVDNKLSGSILWPGASTDGNGNATGWPGWAQVDGAWVETGGNFGWTRGPISAKLVVNPEAAVMLSYPEASADCASPTAVSSDSPTALASTGGAISLVAAGVGISALAVGLGITLRRRRANH